MPSRGRRARDLGHQAPPGNGGNHGEAGRARTDRDGAQPARGMGWNASPNAKTHTSKKTRAPAGEQAELVATVQSRCGDFVSGAASSKGPWVADPCAKRKRTRLTPVREV